MIRIENLSVSYKETLALKDISLVLPWTDNYRYHWPKRCWKINIIKRDAGELSHIKVRHFSMTRKLKNPYIESPMSNKKSISTTTFPSRSRNVSR